MLEQLLLRPNLDERVYTDTRDTEAREPVTAVMAWGYFDQHHSEPGQGFEPDYGQGAAARALGEIVGRALGTDHGVRCVAVCERRYAEGRGRREQGWALE